MTHSLLRPRSGSSGFVPAPPVAQGPTLMPTSINGVLHADVFQRLCVTCGVW
ncbi:hypothetical protein FTUN_7031 [Frigoriglobus tundricola]|uniref:Uncharacterized protein n=1 Tax=Frigoriglobus tundricola TaxID=2774151 RepID=A0A6M5YZE3_9BACT|nr:hypothetical protein FTUN_7031 [Frigoriglobus tundricola]